MGIKTPDIKDFKQQLKSADIVIKQTQQIERKRFVDWLEELLAEESHVFIIGRGIDIIEAKIKELKEEKYEH